MKCITDLLFAVVRKTGGRGRRVVAALPAMLGQVTALSPVDLTQAVHDNLRQLGLDVLEVVNLRSMPGIHGPAEGLLEAPLTALAELQQRGLICHIGLSKVTARQVEDGRRICSIACVQNHYNLAHRGDDALMQQLASDGIAYVHFFPLGGFMPLQSNALSDVAADLHVMGQMMGRARKRDDLNGWIWRKR